MPTYRMGQAADLLGVSTDTIRRWVDAGRIDSTRTENGQRLIDGQSLAAFAVELGDAERDPAEGGVMAGRSARNHFTGIVTNVVVNEVVAKVEIQAGPHRVVSLMTREAVDELGLEPGVLAVATVKSTNVVVEIPAHP